MSEERAPIDFMMASTSTRCCRCARMAMATPIAPSTMATRQIRLSRPVERFKPSVKAGLLSRKSVTCASGQNLFQAGAHLGDVAVLAEQFEEEAFAGTASLLYEAALFERALGHHHPRTQSHARAHAVGSRTRMAAMRKVLSPIFRVRSYLGVQANEQVLGDHHGRIREHLAEVACRLQIDCAVEGILMRIHCFERDQQRHRIARRRDHGDWYPLPGSVGRHARPLRSVAVLLPGSAGETCARRDLPP